MLPAPQRSREQCVLLAACHRANEPSAGRDMDVVCELQSCWWVEKGYLKHTEHA